MANKKLDVPNFCSTLDDLLPTPKRPRDVNQLAKMIVDLSTDTLPKEKQAVKLKPSKVPTKLRQHHRQDAEG